MIFNKKHIGNHIKGKSKEKTIMTGTVLNATNQAKWWSAYVAGECFTQRASVGILADQISSALSANLHSNHRA